jgi:hypothetical protein
MTLARRFNAGTGWLRGCRRVATIEFTLVSGPATLREYLFRLLPALKGRAKLMRRYASKVLVRSFLQFQFRWIVLEGVNEGNVTTGGGWWILGRGEMT